MAVFKRDGSSKWQIEFVFRGEKLRKSSGTTDKAAAEELERKWRDELWRQDQLGELPRMRVADACDMYWRTVVMPGKGNNLRSTLLSHRSRLALISDFFGEETQLADVATAARISQWKASMLSNGLSPASVDRNLDMLRAILYRAKDEWEVLRTVPNIGKIKLNEHNERVRFLTSDEEKSLITECDKIDRDLTDVVEFLIDTGGRRGDALQLLWEDVLMADRLVSFKRTKEDRPRSVPMTNRVLALLTRRQSDSKSAKVFPYDPNTLAKPTSRKGSRGRFGKSTEPGFRSAWTRAVDAAKIKDLHVHDLRHTFASRLVMAGIPLYTVGELLGHSDPKTTARYAHLQPKAHADAISKLNPSASASAE